MKYVLVTGACGGMGRCAVGALRAQGYGVIALDKEITGTEPDGGILYVAADITDEQSLIPAFEKVRAVTGELFGIVHFAGVYMLDSLVEIKSEDFRRIFDVNVYGAYLVNRTFMPLICTGSRIVITTSELAPLDPLPFTGIYAITKSALDRYAYSLRMELQLLGISVSVIRAGAVRTKMLNVSTDALDAFCENTKLYTCNADRFRRIVNRVEARSVPPEKIAGKAVRILRKKHPKFSFAINRNPLLLLLNAAPKRLQLRAVGRILKDDKKGEPR